MRQKDLKNKKAEDKTLLGLITGGKYKTSKDLPPVDDKLISVMELLGTPTKANDPSLVNLAMALPFVPGPVKKGMRSAIKNMKKWRDVPMSRKIDIDEWKSGAWSPKKEMLEGKKWIEDWYNTYRGPEIEKIKKTMKFQRDGSKSLDGKDYFEFQGEKVKKIHRPYSEFNKGPISLRDVDVVVRRDMDYNTNAQYWFKSPVGYKNGPVGGLNEVALNPKYLNYDILRQEAIEANLTFKQFIKSLGVHEFGHALNFGRNYKLGDAGKMIRNARSISRLQEGARVSSGAMYRNNRGKLQATTREFHKYLSTEQEIYRRIDQLRFELGEDPVRLTKQFVKLRDMEGQSLPYTDLRRVLAHDQIEQLYNKLPAIAPFGIAHGLYKGNDDKNRKY